MLSQLVGRTTKTAGIAALLMLSAVSLTHADDRPRAAPSLPSDTADTVNVTSAAWAERLRLILSGTYGSTFERATLQWVACPKIESWDDDEGTDVQLCEYQFGSGTTRRSGSVRFESDPDGYNTYTIPHKRGPWSTKVKRCKTPAKRNYDRWRLTGISSSGLVGCIYVRRLVDEVIGTNRNREMFALRNRTGFFGTNRAGFEDQVSFRCVTTGDRRGRVTVTCQNALKDRFVFTASKR